MVLLFAHRPDRSRSQQRNAGTIGYISEFSVGSEGESPAYEMHRVYVGNDLHREHAEVLWALPCLDLAEWSLDEVIEFSAAWFRDAFFRPSPLVVGNSEAWPSVADQARVALAGAVLLEAPAAYRSVETDEERGMVLLRVLMPYLPHPAIGLHPRVDIEQQEVELFLHPPRHAPEENERGRILHALNDADDSE